MSSASKIAIMVACWLINDPRKKKQAELYLELKNTSLSLKEYFDRQKSIDKDEKASAIPYSWENLKNKNLKGFRHERSHFDIWEKYGVNSELYHIPNTKAFFVMDVNLENVSREKGYNKSKVIQILREMVSSSFINKEEIEEEYLLDIFYYEILGGDIKRLHVEDFEEAFQKYKWRFKIGGFQKGDE